MKVTDEQLIALLHSGKSLQATAAVVGLSRQRVGQRIAALGLRTAEVRDIRCTYCGAVLSHPGSGRHSPSTGAPAPPSCSKPECRKQQAKVRADRVQAQVRAARAARATTCHSCGKNMQRPPRLDGQPSFCHDPKCVSARVSWLTHNDPVYIEYSKARQRKGGRAVRVADIRKQLHLTRPSDVRNYAAPAQAKAIRARKGTASQREIAREFGVSRSYVWSLWSGRERKKENV